jgi:hypothetical protein
MSSSTASEVSRLVPRASASDIDGRAHLVQFYEREGSFSRR